MALKLGKTVLVEIIAAVQRGMLEGIDISQQLRDLEMEVDPEDPTTVRLTEAYTSSRNWEEQS